MLRSLQRSWSSHRLRHGGHSLDQTFHPGVTLRHDLDGLALAMHHGVSLLKSDVTLSRLRHMTLVVNHT